MGSLDQAALRRFVFKVEFRFLRPEQAAAVRAEPDAAALVRMLADEVALKDSGPRPIGF